MESQNLNVVATRSVNGQVVLVWHELARFYSEPLMPNQTVQPRTASNSSNSSFNASKSSVTVQKTISSSTAS